MYKTFTFPEQSVLAKRDIPLQMKFGPFVGDIKPLSEQQMKKYRDMNSEFPLLFLGHDTILDVSNESTFSSLKQLFCFIYKKPEFSIPIFEKFPSL